VERLAALLTAGLLSQAGAGLAAPGPAGPVQVEAGTISYDAALDRYFLADGAILRHGASTLRARSATYDPRAGSVEATGEVLLLEPGRAVAADGLHLLLDGPFEAREVVAFFKGAPLDLSKSATIAEAGRTGRNRLALRSGKVEGKGGDRFTAEGVRLTLCDCGDGAPSWEIRASRADVVPGERAILTWPVLYVTPRFLFIDTPIPILPMPWLYLPLSSRHTGLLVPAVSYGSRTGWDLSLPVFVTLGPSWDVTATLEYAFGPSPAPDVGGVKGPGASLDLRWAPAEGTSGEAVLHALRDSIRYPGGPPDGWRLAFRLLHAQRLSDRAFLAADAAVVNDPLYPQDFVGDLLLRTSEYTRSALALGYRTSDVLLEADAAYHMQIGTLGQPGVPAVPFGLFGGRVPSFHRLPAASATLLPVRLAGPVRVSGSLAIARFAPVEGITDRSANGIGPGESGWTGPPLPPGGGWLAGQRLAASRLSTQAEVRAPFSVGGVLSVEPWARGSAAGYAFAEGTRPSQLDAWGVAGVTASTEISRTFGSGETRLRHSIEPRAEWRWGSGLLGPALPAYAYDEGDRTPALPGAPGFSPPSSPGTSAGTACPLGPSQPGCLPLRSLSAGPSGPWSQLRLSLGNRLAGASSGPLSRAVLEIDLGQDLDLVSGKLAETWARARATTGPFTASLLARFLAFGARAPPGTWTPQYPSGWLDPFTEIRADASFADGRGDSVHAGILGMGTGASASIRAGLDPLFDERAIPFQAIAQATAGAKVRLLGGLDATYEALANARTVVAPSCRDSAVLEPRPAGLQQQTLGLVWSSPCQCWRAGLAVRLDQCGNTGFAATLDLSQLGDLRILP
jgi:LPS-assembly protein